MYEINLLFLSLPISFIAGLATAELIIFLKYQDKYVFGKGLKYIGIFGLSLITGGIRYYSYEYYWLDSFILVPVFYYILFTALIYYTAKLSILYDFSLEPEFTDVDSDTKFSDQEWQTELLGRTTGASPWTVYDENDNIYRDLGCNKTWRKQAYSQRSDIDSDGTNSMAANVSKTYSEIQRRKNNYEINNISKKHKLVGSRNWRGLDPHS